MWVFILASCVHFVGVIFYAIFASGEKQHWAEIEGEEQMAWEPESDVPELVAKKGYGYGNDEGEVQAGGGLLANNGSATYNTSKPFVSQMYRTNNQPSVEDDAFHQNY